MFFLQLQVDLPVSRCFLYPAGLFFRYVVFSLTSILVLLYIAEAIFVDVFIWNFYESGEEEIVFPCLNVSRNYREPRA